MAAPRKSVVWILSHLAAIAAVLVSLLSGLRIASLSKPFIADIGELLPQGQVHELHFFSGCALGIIAFGYICFCTLRIARSSCDHYLTNVDELFSVLRNASYHRVVIWIGCAALLAATISGGLLFLGFSQPALLRTLHFSFALAITGYIFLHGGVYFVQLGHKIFLHILSPAASFNLKSTLFVSIALLALLAGWRWMSAATLYPLPVYHIAPDAIIDIDGEANEPAWQQAKVQTIETDGGANFTDGHTQVQLQALRNEQEIYFHIRWQDPTKSLIHLPLEKTTSGWTIRQNGFHNFNETEYYEDKFAILLSTSCAFGAAGTAHLGRKPLAEKPGNWHGLGYHYSDSEQIHDLWHWKAVRTNDMYLADDNFIGKPDINRSASRRYTAGYQQDGKESGAYVMNWQWYKSGQIIPKRIPADLQALDQFQHSDNNPRWVIPWFDYRPYNKAIDTFPNGTLMPSVIYNSNRFEGDRADVRAHGVWRDGFWSLELVRKLDTGSPLDVAISNGVCMWVSAFDHAQIAHTRHTRAIQLVMQ